MSLAWDELPVILQELGPVNQIGIVSFTFEARETTIAIAQNNLISTAMADPIDAQTHHSSTAHDPNSTVVSGDDPDAQWTVGRYLATRIPTLRPPMNHAPNPIKLIRLLNTQQWLFFLVAFIAWTWDAFDFFTVSLTVTDLAEEFDRPKSDITWGITLVLMLRSVGSAIFGIAADRWGRKWPFVVNNVLFIVLELATGFCNTYREFLAVRALFGIAMGGLYGNAAATALEDCPEAARGVISGMLQQGYAFGYLLATVFARGLVNTTSHGWRPVSLGSRTPKVLDLGQSKLMF